MMKTNNLLTTGILYVIGSFFSQGIRFLTLPYFSHIMTPEDYGYIASYEVWVSVMLIFVGLQTAATIANAYIDFGKDKIEQYTSTVTSIGILSFMVLLILLCVFYKCFESIFELNSYILICGLVQCFFNYAILMVNAKYRIQGRPGCFLTFSIGMSVISIVIAMILVYNLNANRYLGYIFGFFAGNCIIGSIAIIFIYVKGKRIINKRNAKYALKLSIPLILHNISSVISGRVNQIILLKLVNKEVAGLFNYGNNFAYIVNALYTAFNQAYLPWYYKKLSIGKVEEVKAVSAAYIGFFAYGISGLLLILPELIYIMSDSSYYSIVYIIPITIAAMYVNFLYTFPVNYEYYKKQTKYIALGTMATAGISLLLNLIFINIINIYGAVIVNLITSIILFSFHYYVAKRIIRNYELDLKVFVQNSIPIIITCMVYYATLNYRIIRLICFMMIAIIFVKNYKKIKDAIRN